VHNVSDVMAEPLVPGPSAPEVEIATAKVSAIHKLLNSIWNEQELPDQWKESIIVLLTTNFRRTSLLSTSYNMLWNILYSRLSP
jgi:hypothetical protein